MLQFIQFIGNSIAATALAVIGLFFLDRLFAYGSIASAIEEDDYEDEDDDLDPPGAPS